MRWAVVALAHGAGAGLRLRHLQAAAPAPDDRRTADPKEVWRRYVSATPEPFGPETDDEKLRAAMGTGPDLPPTAEDLPPAAGAEDLPAAAGAEDLPAAAGDAEEAPDGTNFTEPEAVPGLMAGAAPGPALEPTLSPERFRNYVPVPTDAEREVLRFGPTPEPERQRGIDHSCVWKPGQYRCSCKDMLIGCNEASSSCEVKLQGEEMDAPDALKRHFKAVFDRPLLNTLQTLQPISKLHENEHGVLGFPIPNYPWPDDDFSARLKAREDAFRPPEPAEFGHPVFADDAKVRFGAPSSECTAEEFTAIETCFTYFFGCYKNLKDLKEWRTHVDDVTRQELRYGF